MTNNIDNRASIFDIKRYALHDGPGIRVTFFFKGCPLNCWWCHNPESQNNDINEHLKCYSVNEMMKIIDKELVFIDESGGGVTFSGGEPLCQHKVLLETLKKCKENEIHTTIDTTGYASEKIFNRIIDYTDLFLYDLKFIDSDKHKKYAGVDNSVILSNLKKLDELGKKVVIRIPLITGINDGEDINEIITFLKSLKSIRKVNILPYHKYGSHKYDKFDIEDKMKEINPPSEEKVLEIINLFKENGLDVKKGG